MNKQRRKEIKQAVLDTLCSYNLPLELPVKIKAITKSFANVRLISFSKQMSLFNLSYDQMVAIAESTDACAIYDKSIDVYTIFYNDVDRSLISSNRYRWNIAHELGHVVLQHHKKYKESKLFRSTLSKTVYETLEAEANLFAAYILVPHIVLLTCRIQSKADISDICRISGRASDVRYDQFNIWRRRRRCEAYDLEILTFFSSHVESKPLNKRAWAWLNQFRRCRHCGSLVPLSHNYCKICGNPSNIQYRLEDNPMKYPGVEVDEKGRAVVCPVCQNTQLHDDGTFCMICGTEIVNFCINSGPFGECSHDEPLPSNARYCPYCGGESTFLKKGFLSKWNSPFSESVEDSEDDFKLPF